MLDLGQTHMEGHLFRGVRLKLVTVQTSVFDAAVVQDLFLLKCLQIPLIDPHIVVGIEDGAQQPVRHPAVQRFFGDAVGDGFTVLPAAFFVFQRDIQIKFLPGVLRQQLFPFLLRDDDLRLGTADLQHFALSRSDLHLIGFGRVFDVKIHRRDIGRKGHSAVIGKDVRLFRRGRARGTERQAQQNQ